jgi:multiple sugar transport system substrate-binding protein
MVPDVSRLRSRREVLRSALAAGAGAALAAGLGTAGCVYKEPDPPGIVTLDFYTYATPEFIELFEHRLVPQFQAKFPHIRVRVNNSMGDAGYDAKLLTLIAGKMAPDVFHVTQQNFPFYAAKEMLLPLDGLLASDPELKREDFYPQLLQGMSFGPEGKEQLVGLPSDFSTIVLFYNKDLFDQYKVPYPPDSPRQWTREAFLETAKKLTVDDDGDGHTDVFGTANDDAYNRWPAWVWNNGGELFSPDRTRCTMDDPQSIAGLKFYIDLSLRHRVAPTPAQAMGQVMDTQFLAQRCAMVASSRYVYKRYLSGGADGRGGGGLPFAWDLAPMPAGPAGRATTFIFGGNCILKSTPHPTEAWEFLKFLSGPAGAAINLEAGNALPAYRPAAEEAVLDKPDPRVPKRDRLFLDAIAYGRVAYAPPQYADYVNAMSQLHDAYLGIRPVDECCRSFTRQVNDFLSGGVL